MAKSFPQSFQTVFRAAVLFGVLAGLLFSCGEGIRLCPFPATEIVRELQLSLNDAGKDVYPENVLRFEKAEASYYSKFQRSKEHCPPANVCKTPNYSSPFTAADSRSLNFPFYSRFFKSRILSASDGSRAPPFA